MAGILRLDADCRERLHLPALRDGRHDRANRRLLHHIFRDGHRPARRRIPIPSADDDDDNNNAGSDLMRRHKTPRFRGFGQGLGAGNGDDVRGVH